MKNFLASIVRPPYRNLPWLLLAYVAACAIIIRHGGIFSGNLIGFDDHVRMTQVLNWVNGAGWYDRTMMRANPPEGFTSIWSRIVDIPIALVIIAAQQFVQQKTAALIAAAIIPLTELALLFVAAPYFARPLMGKRKARLITLFLIFTSILNVKFFSYSGFLIGQVSHHPWYIILNLVMLGAAARIAMGSSRFSPQLMLGVAAALMTAVGIEGYPLTAGAAGLLAMIAWYEGRPSIASRAGDGLLIGAVGALLLLPMHQPPERWFFVSFAEPSILGVILIFVAGGFLKLEQAILLSLKNKKALSAVAIFLTASAIGASLVWMFPDMLNGAAAGLSPAERRMALSIHFEAQSIQKVSRSMTEFICLAMPILLAIAAGVVCALAAKGRRRVVALCYLGFAVIGGGMSFIFSRYYHHAMTTACVWLLWLWEQAKLRIRKNTNYGMVSVAAFVALCPLWMLFIPAATTDALFASQVLLFPASMQAEVNVCNTIPTADFVNSHYDARTLLLVPQSQSANFLYHSKTRLDFIANYPSHDKFIDNFNFFATNKPEEAAWIAYRHGVDIVAACVYPWSFNPNVPDNQQSFMALLQAGKVPAWLKSVDMPNIRNYRLYQIDKTALAKYAAPQ